MTRTHLLVIEIAVFLLLGDPTQADEGLGARRAYAAFAMTNAGHAETGKALFHESKKTQCVNCHRITGMERSGPNLDGVGEKYRRTELVSHVLEPSLQVMPGYEQVTVLLEDGRTLTGRIERATKLEIRVIDAGGKQTNVNRRDVEEVRSSSKSLMPDDLVSMISEQEFADLIAYLTSLRFGTKQGFTSGGKVVPIPRLKRPIEFVPLHPPAIRFKAPVWCGALPGRPGEFLVLEHQEAKVWRLIEAGDDSRREEYLDLSTELHISANQGLMCLAFHPDFENNGRYFLEYEVKEQGVVKTLIVERRAADDRLHDSGVRSVRLLEVKQPAFNHNGGCLAFGPDGMLYAGFGDGGPQRDPEGYSQDPAELKGSFVRIDVDHQHGKLKYAVPQDNPYVGFEGVAFARPETWAIGFREPWRFSFDPVTNNLWVGDVGQDRFEEVLLVEPGDNHGWNVREGFMPFSKEFARRGARYADPLFAYEHGLGFSVTGGIVYRGSPTSSFYGVYVFGDFNTRRVWGLREQNGKLLDVRELGTAPGGIASFGLDHQGELLLVSYGGQIFRLRWSHTEYE